jgi:uncharacterized membrane protein
VNQYRGYEELPQSQQNEQHYYQSFQHAEAPQYHEPQQQQWYMPPLGYSRPASRFAAGLCYVGFWMTGLLFLIFQNKNRLVRFHAIQSLLFFGGVNIMYVVLINIIQAAIPLISGFALFAFVIMNIIALVAWFVGLISAFSGKWTKLPLVGDIAEQYVNKDATLK